MNKELKDYVLKAQGISRQGLNVRCFIGIFLFGWLIAVVFDMLGKRKLAFFYLFPIIGCLVISRHSGSVFDILIPIIIYILGWGHANVILSRYQTNAKSRIAQIDGLSKDQQKADLLMEKGLLQTKVLNNMFSGMETFLDVLHMSGGEAELLNHAGVVMFSNKWYRESKQFFDRALVSAKNEVLIKQIKQNLTAVAKNLR